MKNHVKNSIVNIDSQVHRRVGQRQGPRLPVRHGQFYEHVARGNVGVVEEVFEYGRPYHFGLEAGSKPELMAVMATLITSNLLLGKLSSSIACNIRGRPNDGSGSPIAADSPNTKMRMVPGSLCRVNVTGWGVRAISPGKNRQPNRQLSVRTSRPLIRSVRKKLVG